jgi:hypothetical protein
MIIRKGRTEGIEGKEKKKRIHRHSAKHLKE